MHTLFGITLVLYLLKLSAGKGCPIEIRQSDTGNCASVVHSIKWTIPLFNKLLNSGNQLDSWKEHPKFHTILTFSWEIL